MYIYEESKVVGRMMCASSIFKQKKLKKLLTYIYDAVTLPKTLLCLGD